MLSRGGKDVAWYQDATALSYGSIALVIHSMNNLWVTYNFPFFLKILADNDDSAWFMLVPLAYLLWNTVDNPVLGWWSDKSTRRDTGRGHGCSVARVQRIRVGIRWMACMFALSWFPLVDFVHLHFLISLCIYGGSLSYVEVNYTSLLAEISTDRAMRGRCTAWASVFSVCGAVPIVYASLTWESHESRDDFKWLCMYVSLFAMGFAEAWRFVLLRRFPSCSSSSSSTPLGSELADTSSFLSTAAHPSSSSSSDGAHGTPKEPPLDFSTFFLELWRIKNFRIFGALHFVQSALCTFEKNHLVLFMSFYAKELMGAGGMGVLIALSFVLPHICTIVASTYIRSHGLHKIIMTILRIKFASVCVGLLLCWVWWSDSTEGEEMDATLQMVVCCGLLLVGRVVTESLCRLFPLVTTAIIEQDRAVNNRSSSVAASIAGSVALLARPGESLAPFVGWMLLTNVAILKKAVVTGDSATSSEGDADAYTVAGVGADMSSPSASYGCVLCAVLLFPAACSSAALLLWRKEDVLEPRHEKDED